MNNSNDSIKLAEKRVAEAKATVLAEYQAIEASVRRRTSSPLLIGGVLLGFFAIGYFAVGRLGKPKRPAQPARPGAWSQIFQTAQLLLYLFGDLKAAREAKTARRTVAAPRERLKVNPGEKHRNGDEHRIHLESDRGIGARLDG